MLKLEKKIFSHYNKELDNIVEDKIYAKKLYPNNGNYWVKHK